MPGNYPGIGGNRESLLSCCCYQVSSVPRFGVLRTCEKLNHISILHDLAGIHTPTVRTIRSPQFFLPPLLSVGGKLNRRSPQEAQSDFIIFETSSIFSSSMRSCMAFSILRAGRTGAAFALNFPASSSWEGPRSLCH